MALHEFGGDWTREKLKRLEDYLPPFMTIMRGNPTAAKYFQTVYIDAFAGTGYVTPHQKKAKQQDGHAQATPSMFDALVELDEPIGDEEEPLTAPDTREFLDGSARIALNTPNPFDLYIFIDKKASHVRDLEALKQEFPHLSERIKIRRGDANHEIAEICRELQLKKWRGVLFLDPYGMQVDWKTIEIAANAHLDLWLLFPIGVAVNRLLTTNGMPPENWAAALDRAMGDGSWREQFYATVSPAFSLFDDEDERERIIKIATFDSIAKFFVERLATVYPAECIPKPLPLLNSQNIPLYLLCFASHNKTARKIAEDVLKP